MDRLQHYKQVRDVLEQLPNINRVLLDEDYASISGNAAFSPYDVVIEFSGPPEFGESEEWTEEEVKRLFVSHGIEFDRVVSVAEETNMIKGFVSLEKF